MSRTIFEEMNGTYENQGDYFIPKLEVAEENEVHIGVWGQRYRKYLKAHHRVLYYNYLTSGKLYKHLADVDNRAETIFNQLVKSLAEQENITEKLKADDMMLWVQKMNNIRSRVTEIVNNEVIFM